MNLILELGESYPHEKIELMSLYVEGAQVSAALELESVLPLMLLHSGELWSKELYPGLC